MNLLLARRGRELIAACAAIGFLAQIAHLVVHNSHQDLFIYRTGATLGWAGHSPYDAAALKARVTEQYPHDSGLIENCGFFLAPQAVVVFGPVAALPWGVAKWAWTVGVVALAAVACRKLIVFASSDDALQYTPWVAAGLLLNPFTGAVLIVGQTTLFVFAIVVLGEAAYRAGWKRAAALLWALAFIKPHLALPLIPVAWYLGGWKRAGEIILWVIGLNLAGCLLAAGTPLFLNDYLDHLAAGHKTVEFNRVERNPQITSWNRVLLAVGGPVIELSAPTTLAGYAVWFGIMLARVAIAGHRPSPAWALAVAAAGAVVCCQVLAYELGLLALVAPLVFDWALARRLRIVGYFTAAFLFVSIPFEVFQFIDAMDIVPEFLREFVASHRSLGTMFVASGVISFGWPKRFETTTPAGL